MQVNRSFNRDFLILELSSRRIAWGRSCSYVTIVGWRLDARCVATSPQRGVSGRDVRCAKEFSGKLPSPTLSVPRIQLSPRNSDLSTFQITKSFVGKSIKHRDAATPVLRLQFRGGGSMRWQTGCNQLGAGCLPKSVLIKPRSSREGDSPHETTYSCSCFG